MVKDCRRIPGVTCLVARVHGDTDSTAPWMGYLDASASAVYDVQPLALASGVHDIQAQLSITRKYLPPPQGLDRLTLEFLEASPMQRTLFLRFAETGVKFMSKAVL